MLKILHLLSNWKWTERAEPASDMVLGQVQLGADATFVCGRCPFDASDAVEHRVLNKGIQPIVLDLTKHFDPFQASIALPQLIRFMKERQFDIIHAHMTNAHLLAGLAARRALPGARVVATFYEPAGPQPGFRNRLLINRLMDGAVVITPHARESLVKRFGFPDSRVAVIEPGLDVARFQSDLSKEAARALFGLAPSDLVVGMVTRIREARRLDLILEAVAKLAPKYSNLKLMIVGRGGEGAVEEVVEGPAEALGIRSRILLPGYCRDNMLVAAYKAMDVLAYPSPGTDPSCRTVREALAAGVPVVACDVGFLPTLVGDGETGYLASSNPEPIAEVLNRLLADPLLRHRMSRQAGLEAQERFSNKTQAGHCLRFYERLGTRR